MYRVHLNSIGEEYQAVKMEGNIMAVDGGKKGQWGAISSSL